MSKAITDKTKIANVIKDFNDEIIQWGFNAKLVCSNVLELTDTSAASDPSYGANCTYKTKDRTVSVMVCNDTMIGKFTVGGSGDLLDFTRNNCMPGG